MDVLVDGVGRVLVRARVALLPLGSHFLLSHAARVRVRVFFVLLRIQAAVVEVLAHTEGRVVQLVLAAAAAFS